MELWYDETYYQEILTKLVDNELSFCSKFKQCEGFDRGFYGKINKIWIFAKLSKAEKDKNLIDELANGLKINEFRQEIPNFLYTFTLTKVKKCHFPTGKWKFPRDVLFTEYAPHDILYFQYKDHHVKIHFFY